MNIKKILLLSNITFKGGIRDKTLVGIGILSLLFMLSTPLFASFSPRQPTAVAIDYSLSVLSLTGLLLTLFLGVHLMAGDIDKRSIYTVITQPISRDQYIFGKYIGLISIIFVSILIISVSSIPGIYIAQKSYGGNNAIFWDKYILSILFIFLKLCVMASAIFLFSTVATSTFLPFSIGIAFYFVSESIESVKRYIEGYGIDLTSNSLKLATKFIYYIFPNFSALDLKEAAIYGIALEPGNIAYLTCYGVFYIIILLILTILIFNRREFT